jgi:putative hydrolase of the HAD superfamily
MTPPLALIFDLDDTLIRAYANRDAAWRDHLAGYAAALHPHDTVHVADTISSHAARFWRDPDVYDRGGHDLEAARRTIVSAAFRDLAIDARSLAAEIADAFTAKRKQGYELFEDTLPVLTRLKDSGIKLGLLTNGGRDSQRAKLERFALSAYFDYIGISEEIGHAKPDAAIFELALSALDATAANAWMVGDHLEWDIAGAQAVGMAGVWFNPNDAPLPANPLPDHVITDLGQLPDLLQNA